MGGKGRPKRNTNKLPIVELKIGTNRKIGVSNEQSPKENSESEEKHTPRATICEQKNQSKGKEQMNSMQMVGISGSNNKSSHGTAEGRKMGIHGGTLATSLGTQIPTIKSPVVQSSEATSTQRKLSMPNEMMVEPIGAQRAINRPMGDKDETQKGTHG